MTDLQELLHDMHIKPGINEIDDLMNRFEDLGYYDEDPDACEYNPNYDCDGKCSACER